MAQSRLLLWFPLLACLPVAGISLLAQPRQDPISAGSASGGWSVRDPYPNSLQIKTEMSGSEAIPLNSGLVLVSNLVIKGYPLTGGKPRSVIEAPECSVDPQSNLAFSAGPLKVRAEDGKLFVDGVGFRYEGANSLLAVSNRVHTIVYQAGASPTNAVQTNAPPTHLHSDSLLYAMKTGQAVYQGHVRVIDPKMYLRAGILTAQLPPEGSKSTHLGDSVAERDVQIDFYDDQGTTNHALGDRAVYKYLVTPAGTNEFLELSGHPRIDLTNGWMTADLFTFDRLQDRIRALGNYHFHSSANVQFAGPAEPNAPAGETEITSDFFEFEIKTGNAGYEGRVRVRNPRLELDAEKLLARLPPGGQKSSFSQRITAETSVLINFIDKDGRIRGTSDHAVYTYLQLANNVLTNEVLELTGNPILERTNGWTAADTIILDRSANKLFARGHHHSILKSAPTGSAASVTATNALGTSDTEIFSDNAKFDAPIGTAFFTGQARAFDPRFTISSQTLTAKLPAQGGRTNHLEHIEAQTHVIIDAKDEKGETTHATADKAIYDYKVTGGVTNETVELIGHPTVKQSGKNHPDFSAAKSVVYNRITGEITVKGAPTINLQPGAQGQTNPPAAPNPVGR